MLYEVRLHNKGLCCCVSFHRGPFSTKWAAAGRDRWCCGAVCAVWFRCGAGRTVCVLSVDGRAGRLVFWCCLCYLSCCWCGFCWLPMPCAGEKLTMFCALIRCYTAVLHAGCSVWGGDAPAAGWLNTSSDMDEWVLWCVQGGWQAIGALQFSPLPCRRGRGQLVAKGPHSTVNDPIALCSTTERKTPGAPLQLLRGSLRLFFLALLVLYHKKMVWCDTSPSTAF